MNTMNISRPSGKTGEFASQELYDHIYLYVFWVHYVISLAGLVNNSLIIAVFARQGYKESTSVSLTFIACWDLLKNVCNVVASVHVPLGWLSPADGDSFDAATVPTLQYATTFCSYVSYALACYVSIERCMCVAIPFKVKRIFTPGLTSFVMTSISVVVFGAFVVVFFIYEFYYIFSPERNQTVLTYRYSEFYYAHGRDVLVYYRTASILVPTASLLVLSISSLLTLAFLRRASGSLTRITSKANSQQTEEPSVTGLPQEKRQDSGKKTPSTGLSQKERQMSVKGLSTKEKEKMSEKERPNSGLSQKEKRIAKMFLVIVLIYVVNLTPRVMVYIAQLVEPEFYIMRRYHYLFFTVVVFIFILDYTNSSVNFFIYFRMSEKFRAEFFAMCRCRR